MSSFTDPNATRQLANTNYVVGIRAAPHICGIRWWQDPNDRYSFTVSGDTGAVTDLLGKYSAQPFTTSNCLSITRKLISYLKTALNLSDLRFTQQSYAGDSSLLGCDTMSVSN